MNWKRTITCVLMVAISACLSFCVGSFWRGLKDASEMSTYRIRVRSCLEMVYDELEFLEKEKDIVELQKYIKQSRMPLFEVTTIPQRYDSVSQFVV